MDITKNANIIKTRITLRSNPPSSSDPAQHIFPMEIGKHANLICLCFEGFLD
uniref:Uncharacterized protein n=1 Tax=Manihot esculenta TaxID=3983 RepID=A0A2C9UD43_MANES